MKYPLIHSNGFMYAVDKEDVLINGDYKHCPLDDVNKIHKQEGQYYDTQEFKIVATNDPSLNLPLLPAVEEDLNTPAFEYVKNQSQELKNKHPLIPRMLSSAWKAGYEAASAKQFTDEDIVAAFNAGRQGFGGALKQRVYDWKNAYDYIESLKPKPVAVEIEMDRSLDVHLITSDDAIPAVNKNNYVKVKQWYYE